MSLNAVATKGAEGLSRSNTVKFNVIALLTKWRMKYRGRGELAALPDFMLKDIGISRSQIEQEYTKPFWKN